MTLQEIIDKIKAVASQVPNVNTAEEGNIYDLMNGNRQVKYAAFILTQGTHRYDETQMLYTFNMFYIDRLVNDLETNRTQIQSQGIEVLKNVINQVCSEQDIDRTQVTFDTWTERFNDLCAGAYCNVTFQVPADDCYEQY